MEPSLVQIRQIVYININLSVRARWVDFITHNYTKEFFCGYRCDY